MLSSDVRSFTDPDAYAAAIRQSAVQLTVTGRGYFTAQIIRIDLQRLWMQRFSDNLPRIAHTDSLGGRVVISFRTQPGPSLILGRGRSTANGYHTAPRERKLLSALVGSHWHWSDVTAAGRHGVRRAGNRRM